MWHFSGRPRSPARRRSVPGASWNRPAPPPAGERVPSWVRASLPDCRRRRRARGPRGSGARRCDPAVQERFHSLLAAVGKESDGRIAGDQPPQNRRLIWSAWTIIPAGIHIRNLPRRHPEKLGDPEKRAEGMTAHSTKRRVRILDFTRFAKRFTGFRKQDLTVAVRAERYAPARGSRRDGGGRRFGLHIRHRFRLVVCRGVECRTDIAHGDFPGYAGEGHFALAAIAAAQALLAEMIGACVLGATRANPRGFLSANATHEGHGGVYFFLPVLVGTWVTMARQR